MYKITLRVLKKQAIFFFKKRFYILKKIEYYVCSTTLLQSHQWRELVFLLLESRVLVVTIPILAFTDSHLCPSVTKNNPFYSTFLMTFCSHLPALSICPYIMCLCMFLKSSCVSKFQLRLLMLKHVGCSYAWANLARYSWQFSLLVNTLLICFCFGLGI